MSPDVSLAESSAITPQVYEDLIAWTVKLSSGGASSDDRQQFLAWRALDPMHEAAWKKLNSIEQNLSDFSADSRQVATQTLAILGKQDHRRAKSSKYKLMGWAVIALLGAGLVGNQYAPWQQEFHYVTKVGKQAKFVLADGTHLMLNTNAKVDVKFSLLKREILLHNGEVYIETSKDNDSIVGRRSFWVKTELASLEAIGTKFSVNQQAANTQLYVAEGIVAMHIGKNKPVRAYANETYHMRDGISEPVKNLAESHMDPSAWVDGVLVAKQMRLTDFVAELSRYQDLTLICDSNASNMAVSGVFQLNRTEPAEHALNAIARTLPLSITKQDKVVFIKRE